MKIEKNLKDTIEEVGIENCLFLVSMLPVNVFFGIAFTSSNDTEAVVPTRI